METALSLIAGVAIANFKKGTAKTTKTIKAGITDFLTFMLPKLIFFQNKITKNKTNTGTKNLSAWYVQAERPKNKTLKESVSLPFFFSQSRKKTKAQIKKKIAIIASKFPLVK